MNKLVKWISLLLAMVLMFSVAGCGEEESLEKKPTTQKTEAKSKVDMSAYIGTWQGSDHDGENVLHYLLFGKDGYWHVYMNYESLSRAISQRDQYVSFMVTFEGNAEKGKKPLNVSAHTGCYYEYVEYAADEFSMDKSGKVTFTSAKDVLFTKISDQSDTPGKTIVEQNTKMTIADQSRDLFDRAKENADTAEK